VVTPLSDLEKQKDAGSDKGIMENAAERRAEAEQQKAERKAASKEKWSARWAGMRERASKFGTSLRSGYDTMTKVGGGAVDTLKTARYIDKGDALKRGASAGAEAGGRAVSAVSEGFKNDWEQTKENFSERKQGIMEYGANQLDALQMAGGEILGSAQEKAGKIADKFNDWRREKAADKAREKQADFLKSLQKLENLGGTIAML